MTTSNPLNEALDAVARDQIMSTGASAKPQQRTEPPKHEHYECCMERYCTKPLGHEGENNLSAHTHRVNCAEYGCSDGRSEPTLRDMELQLSAQATALEGLKKLLGMVGKDVQILKVAMPGIGHVNRVLEKIEGQAQDIKDIGEVLVEVRAMLMDAGLRHLSLIRPGSPADEQRSTTHGQTYHAWIPPGESQAASSRCPVCRQASDVGRVTVRLDEDIVLPPTALAAATERLVQAALDTYDWMITNNLPGTAPLGQTVAAYRAAKKEASHA